MNAPAKPKNPWIQCARPNPDAKFRLFCFPYAGGGSLIFYHWSNALPADIEVCALQPPGREQRVSEAPIDRFEPLLDALEAALVDYLDRPFAFFGHSLGAFMSFELARRLRARNVTGLRHLFVSACRAPQLPDRDSPVHHLPKDELIAELRRYNGTPQVLLENAELMEFLLPLLRADFALFETYRYLADEPLTCPITAFGGLNDRKATEAEIEQWRAMTVNRFEMQLFPGDHFYLNTQREELLRVITATLEQLRGG